MRKAAEIGKGYAKLTAKELMEKFKANDPDLLLVMSKNSYASDLDYYNGKDPNLASRFKPSIELLRKIEIKEGDEKVSLRSDFEKVGVVAHQQTTDACFQHASYHAYQYQLKKNKLPAPSYEGFIQMSGGGAGYAKAMFNFKLPDGRKPQIYDLNLGGVAQLERELVKHQLRNGIPCIISVIIPNIPGHVVLAIGFETKDGKTTFEYLDSNRVWQDKGYRTIDSDNVIPRGGFSAWFE